MVNNLEDIIKPSHQARLVSLVADSKKKERATSIWKKSPKKSSRNMLTILILKKGKTLGLRVCLNMYKIKVNIQKMVNPNSKENECERDVENRGRL